MAMANGIDYQDDPLEPMRVYLGIIPITALSSTVERLNTLLQEEHLLVGKNNYWRDWRALSRLVGHSFEEMQACGNSEYPVRKVLMSWPRTCTIGLLLQLLEKIERYDVIDECLPKMKADAENFLSKRETWGCAPSGILQSKYHAFVVHAEQDTEFVKQLSAELEIKRDFSLFIPTRDSTPGIDNERVEMLHIMERRCEKILIVVSSHLASDVEANSILSNAETQQLNRPGTVIPVAIELCEPVGNVVRNLSSVKFYEGMTSDWQWQRLVNALKSDT